MLVAFKIKALSFKIKELKRGYCIIDKYIGGLGGYS
jgi:hypothetical protein